MICEFVLFLRGRETYCIQVLPSVSQHLVSRHTTQHDQSLEKRHTNDIKAPFQFLLINMHATLRQHKGCQVFTLKMLNKLHLIFVYRMICHYLHHFLKIYWYNTSFLMHISLTYINIGFPGQDDK